MADFQSSFDELKAQGINVIAASADPIEDAKKAVEELGIKYHLAYGVDAEAIARTLGSYYEVYKEAHPVEHTEEEEAEITGEHSEVRKKFTQPVGILVRPDKTIDVISYSSAHIGRISAPDVLSLVKYYKDNNQ